MASILALLAGVKRRCFFSGHAGQSWNCFGTCLGYNSVVDPSRFILVERRGLACVAEYSETILGVPGAVGRCSVLFGNSAPDFYTD